MHLNPRESNELLRHGEVIGLAMRMRQRIVSSAVNSTELAASRMADEHPRRQAAGALLLSSRIPEEMKAQNIDYHAVAEAERASFIDSLSVDGSPDLQVSPEVIDDKTARIRAASDLVETAHLGVEVTNEQFGLAA